MTSRDATLRWRFSPTKGRNSLGLRNREVGPKQPGSCRILVLGDSLVWSGETSSGKLYTEVVESRLPVASRFGAIQKSPERSCTGAPANKFRQVQFQRLAVFLKGTMPRFRGFHYRPHVQAPVRRQPPFDREAEATTQRQARQKSRNAMGIAVV